MTEKMILPGSSDSMAQCASAFPVKFSSDSQPHMVAVRMVGDKVHISAQPRIYKLNVPIHM